uniref:Uncharacterized protein n=1 Tax=Timema poppense TaxID=170557 RepID=A0A7R9D6V0_TIMPO|nr:unnamed protein product [Timema poppensis]
MLTTEDFKQGGQAVCHGATRDKSLGSSSTSRGCHSSPRKQSLFGLRICEKTVHKQDVSKSGFVFLCLDSDQSEGKLSLSNVVLHVQNYPRLATNETHLGKHCLPRLQLTTPTSAVADARRKTRRGSLPSMLKWRRTSIGRPAVATAPTDGGWVETTPRGEPVPHYS